MDAFEEQAEFVAFETALPNGPSIPPLNKPNEPQRALPAILGSEPYLVDICHFHDSIRDKYGFEKNYDATKLLSLYNCKGTAGPSPPLLEPQGTGETPWMQFVAPATPDLLPLAALNQEIGALLKWIRPTPEEYRVRVLCIELVRTTIAQAFPGTKVLCFGSVVSGLVLPGSDIDLTIVFPHPPSNGKNFVRRLQQKVAQILINNKVISRNDISFIPWATVPIIKCVTLFGEIPLDISFNQKDASKSSVNMMSILRQYSSLDYPPSDVSKQRTERYLAFLGDTNADDASDTPISRRIPPLAVPTKESDELLRPSFGVAYSLIIILKLILRQNNLGNAALGGLGSYGTACLVISFIQGHRNFNFKEIQQNPTEHLALLLLSFLEFYSTHFDVTVGLSLRDSGYSFTKQNSKWERFGGSMVVLDSFSGDLNVARSARNWKQIALFFGQLRTSLLSAMRASLLNAVNQTQHPSSGPPSSLLCHIVSIPHEEIVHRHKLREVYQSGVLHQRLYYHRVDVLAPEAGNIVFPVSGGSDYPNVAQAGPLPRPHFRRTTPGMYQLPTFATPPQRVQVPLRYDPRHFPALQLKPMPSQSAPERRGRATVSFTDSATPKKKTMPQATVDGDQPLNGARRAKRASRKAKLAQQQQASEKVKKFSLEEFPPLPSTRCKRKSEDSNKGEASKRR